MKKRQYGLATAQKWLQKSNQRVEPNVVIWTLWWMPRSGISPVEMQRKAKEKALFSV